MGYAFISYCSKDQSAADALRDLLNSKGIDTWMAPGDIPVGSEYPAVINHAIKESACFVLLLSNAAQNSPWVPREIEKAVSNRIPIFPVKIEDVVLNDAFDFYLGTNQIVAVQKIDQTNEELKKFIKCFKTSLNKFFIF